MPKDRFGREINYLRISVIDHCNLRCVYCMPLRGLSFVPSRELLTAEEIETVAQAAVQVGFRKFRLTGGEPTLRPEIVEIVHRIAATPGVAAMRLTISTMSERSVGSPPVRRNLWKPTCTAACATVSISSAVNSSGDGTNESPRSGMQYTQRRLQWSMTEIRR